MVFILFFNFTILYWFCHMSSSVQLCDPMDCSTPGFPVLHCLPEFAQIHVHWVQMLSNHLILCCPLLLLPSISPSVRVFSNESALRIRWPKYWSFSFCISPSNEHSGLISFRIDRYDLLAVQGILKSSLQDQSSKASVLLCSAFFMVQLSHLYMTGFLPKIRSSLPGLWRNHLGRRSSNSSQAFLWTTYSTGRNLGCNLMKHPEAQLPP